ncbi:arginine--tRNA ligase [Candidatus Woesebacteria bacterium RIFCSPLOWO2_12_FULL_39_9]|nr:MAG: arginine--tRNA ligase [Candidatus Woesebacteria bacterium RIFCSPLOWO2_12_FULL_39_9]
METPENEEFGDYSSNIALQLFAEIKNEKSKVKITNQNLKDSKSPRNLAQKLTEELKKDKGLSEIVEQIEVAGPGFINFRLAGTVLVSMLKEVIERADKFGESEILKGSKIVVEFAHPNTHKQFHIGHLRNICTGEAICRILAANGTKVVRVNYQGDVGLHIAKAIYGIQKIGFEDPGDVKGRMAYLGKAYVEGSQDYEEDEDAKEKIANINKKLYEKSDPELLELYEATRKWSLDYFETIYKRVYVKFDRLYFESEVFKLGKERVLEGLEKGIFERSEGAVIFPGKKFGLHDRVFITSEDVPTYEAKDMGLAELQFAEYNPDFVLHVVGPEQTEYFRVVFKALEALKPEIKNKEIHIVYGWVRLKEGKMASRTGNVVLGEWLLDEVKEEIIKTYKSEENVAEKVAIAAVKYSFLKVGLSQEIAFDIKESISLEGNSGPYLQYTVARTNSVLRKVKYNSYSRSQENAAFQGGDELSSDMSSSFRGNPALLARGGRHKNYNNYKDLKPEELSLLRTFIHYPEVVEEATKNYAPNLLCNYLYDVAQKFNLFYQKHGILKDESVRVEEQESVRDFRLALTAATGQILKNGLYLLGIQAPKSM